MFKHNKILNKKAQKIKLLLTDVDGVLTDGGVYYSVKGEELKKFNIRDGMGVARLREAGIECGIITGEVSQAVFQRAKKLNIKETHLGIKDKSLILDKIMKDRRLSAENIAYIGDDCNDLSVIDRCALTACPADALYFVKDRVDYVCLASGGNGAFREFAELILFYKSN